MAQSTGEVKQKYVDGLAQVKQQYADKMAQLKLKTEEALQKAGARAAKALEATTKKEQDKQAKLVTVISKIAVLAISIDHITTDNTLAATPRLRKVAALVAKIKALTEKVVAKPDNTTSED